jgi:adenylate cyclase
MTWRRRLSKIVGFGTERYPEKVALRLRAVNIACWLVALVPGYFAVLRFVDAERWDWGFLNLLFAVVIASIPLLHRFGAVAAPLGLLLVLYLQVYRVVIGIGTGDGAYLGILSATVLFVVVVGVERVVLAGVMAVAGAALMIWLHVRVPYNIGTTEIADMHIAFAVNVVANAAILFGVMYYAMRAIARAETALTREHERSESLLSNILPPQIAARLKDRHRIADRYDAASVLFADMAGFTARASDTEPDQLVGFLDDVFGRIDALVERHGVEKIKTTGDAYMVVAGVPEPRADHAEALATLALDMRDALVDLVDPKGRPVPIRIGLASGPVVAGVVGRAKFFYDVWGDAVNTAARMEQTAEPGTIQVAPEMAAALQAGFILDDRGVIDVRGKGEMRTSLLRDRR